MRIPLRRIRDRIRRELQLGGLTAVRQDDRRILPWITVDPFLIDRRHPTFGDRRATLFREDLDFETDWISIEAFDTFDVRPRFYREVFAAGLPLRETTEFRYHLDMIARDGTTWHGIGTEDGVLRYLEGKVRLFQDIRRAGEIRPNLEISGKRRDEIGCLIDHRGRLIKGKSGNNRFAIARMLRIRSVPVQIDAIHFGQIPVVNRCPGATPIARINRYLQRVQEDHRPSPDRTQGPADDGVRAARA
jgi:hypothetical protein